MGAVAAAEARAASTILSGAHAKSVAGYTAEPHRGCSNSCKGGGGVVSRKLPQL